MDERSVRTEMLIGTEAVERLKRSCVAVFGIGGVGAYCAEALARAGVGRLLLIDGDTVSTSNINRQLIALGSTVGRPKALVMAERIRDIDARIDAVPVQLFYLPENEASLELTGVDVIIDCVDTVAAKVALAVRGYREGIPVISCMGAGNKLDPAAFTVSDIYETSACPLARVMRHELRKRNIPSLTAVWSREEARTPLFQPEDAQKRATPGSISFVPGVCGLIAAGEAVKKLISL